jgi:sugar O-acyltransferase (sialic acid O-acetyltransferase NeuD family)
MTDIVLIGATGGCADILNIIQDANDAGADYRVLGFLDDKPDLWGESVFGELVLGGLEKAAKLPKDCFFVSGVGSPYNHWKRGKVIDGLGIERERFATIKHPTASISRHAKIGVGTVLSQYSVVGPDVLIGDHVLVLPQVVINHGCKIGDHTIITSGVIFSGEVLVEESCYLGSQSTIRQNVSIGKNALVGMGSVVLKDVEAYTAVAGNPAGFIRFHAVTEAP